MKIFRKRFLSAILAACTAGAALTGCSGNSSSSVSSETNLQSQKNVEENSQTDQNGKADSGNKVNLTFYSWSDEKAYLDAAVSAYNAQSDIAEVKITYFPPTEYSEKMLATFASGGEFDVLCVNGLGNYGEYISKNAIQDITSYVKESGVDTSVYGNVFASSNKDKIYGLPYRGAVWLMFANEGLFEKAGVPFTQDQLTWDEYRELAKKLTKDGTYGGLVGMDNLVLLQQLGGTVMDEDTTKIRESLELWKNLEDDGSHIPFAEKLELGQNAGSMFTAAPANRVATFQNGTWGIAAYNAKYKTNEMPFKYRVMPMPIPEGAKDYTAPMSMNFLSIPNSSKHPKEAYDFIKWMCGKDGAMIIAENATLPAYSDDDIKAAYLKAADQPDDVLAKIVFSPNNMPDEIYDLKFNEVSKILKEEQELYMVGEQDLDTTMKNFETRRSEAISR